MSILLTNFSATSRLLFRNCSFLHKAMSTTVKAPLILSPKELIDIQKTDKHVAILDASWFMPNVPRKGLDEFKSKRIPATQFLDLDKVASPHELGLMHMMPSERVFADACEKFGITPSSHVAIYDSQGVFSSPRALFMFRAFGHSSSSIINGGLPRWEDEGLPLETGSPSIPEKSEYPTPVLNGECIRIYEQMVSNSKAKSSAAELVLDARSRERFDGSAPEPRPGLPSGHIPNSFSLPFTVFLDTNTTSTGKQFTTFKTRPEIWEQLIEAVGVDKCNQILNGDVPVTTTCGSGMTAAVLWLGLQLLGVKRVSLYDESWTGYASRKESSIATAAKAE